MTVTLKQIQDSDAVLLVRWRNENAEWFPVAPKLTVSSHLDWFNDVYLRDPAQTVCMVSLDGKRVGVVGVIVRDGMAEVGRLILGDKSVRGAMHEGVKQLMNAFGLQYYWAYTMSGNTAAIGFFERLGFYVYGEPGDEYTDVHGNRGRYVQMERGL